METATKAKLNSIIGDLIDLESLVLALSESAPQTLSPESDLSGVLHLKSSLKLVAKLLSASTENLDDLHLEG